MKLVVVLNCAPDFEPAARYTLATMLEMTGVPYEFVSVPPVPPGNCLIIAYGGEDKDNWPERTSIVIANDRKCCDLDSLVAEQMPDGTLILPDLVAAAFSLLTQYEVNGEVLDLPLVNIYAWYLFDVLVQAARSEGMSLLQICPWPWGHRYAVALSHDVDQTELYNAANGVLVLKRALQTREWRGILRGAFYTAMGLKGWLAQRDSDPSWHFDRFMALESSAGFRSSFYFTPLATSGGRDPAYDITTPRLRAIIGQLWAGGWEVGVHGSFHSGCSSAQLRREREQMEAVLGAPVTGIRQHYLQLAGSETFRKQARAGYSYDTTLGYERTIGFRNGAAFPFHPFDEKSEEALPLLELPLVVMDGALFWHLEYSAAQAADSTLALLQAIRDYQGLATLLWHQRVGDQKRYPGWWRVYELIIDYLREDDEVWVVPGANIAHWWLARESLMVDVDNSVKRGTGWVCGAPRHIEGLTLRVWNDKSRPVDVKGAQAEIEDGEGNSTWVRLNRLCSGQQLGVIIH